MLSNHQINEAHAFYSWLYKTYRPLMFYHAYHYSADKSAAEDIVHDALEKLLAKYESLCKMDCNRLASYIVLTIRSAAISRWRNDKSRLRVMESLQVEDSELPSAEDILMHSINAEAIRLAWEALSDEDQTLLGQKYMLDMSNSELSMIYQCTETTVRSKLFRAKNRLKQALKRIEEVNTNDE